MRPALVRDRVVVSCASAQASLAPAAADAGKTSWQRHALQRRQQAAAAAASHTQRTREMHTARARSSSTRPSAGACRHTACGGGLLSRIETLPTDNEEPPTFLFGIPPPLLLLAPGVREFKKEEPLILATFPKRL